MESEPRNWKWMVPAGLIPLWLYAFWELAAAWMGVALVCLFFALVCTIAMTANYLAYFRHLQVSDFARRQRALATTADSVLLEKAAGVHPETLRQLLSERRLAWMRIGAGESADHQPYSVLHAAPAVTDYFVEYFLDNSTNEKAMPMHGFLVEGRKTKFDPRGAVDEYTMYRQLEQVLVHRRMLTKPYGERSPGLWLPPWGPVSVAAEFGLVWEAPTSQSAVPAKAPWEQAIEDLEQTEVMRGR